LHRWYYPHSTIQPLSIPETVPVNVGEAKFALNLKLIVLLAETGLFASLVLSTFPNQPLFYQFQKQFLYVKVGLNLAIGHFVFVA
jgi:hypothetical protein